MPNQTPNKTSSINYVWNVCCCPRDLMRYYHKATDDHATYASNAAWMLFERLMDSLWGFGATFTKTISVSSFQSWPCFHEHVELVSHRVVSQRISRSHAKVHTIHIHSYIHRTIQDLISHHCKTCMFASLAPSEHPFTLQTQWWTHKDSWPFKIGFKSAHMDKHCADATNRSLASFQGEFAVHLGDLRAAQHPQVEMGHRWSPDITCSQASFSFLALFGEGYFMIFYSTLLLFLFFDDIAGWLSQYLSSFSLLPLLSSLFFLSPFTAPYFFKL